MINKKVKKFFSILLATSLTFSTIGAYNVVEAKGGRISTRPSSKPSTSKPSTSNKSSKPSTNNSASTSSSKPKANSTSRTSSSGTYNKNRNSYNNTEYKRQYTDYINTNYRSSGFFSGSNIVNMLLWYSLFNNIGSHNNTVQATDQQKELVDNVKDSNVPVYMLEIKTNDGETKYISVTKEQYEKVQEGDNISYKDGNLEIK